MTDPAPVTVTPVPSFLTEAKTVEADVVGFGTRVKHVFVGAVTPSVAQLALVAVIVAAILLAILNVAHAEEACPVMPWSQAAPELKADGFNPVKLTAAQMGAVINYAHLEDLGLSAIYVLEAKPETPGAPRELVVIFVVGDCILHYEKISPADLAKILSSGTEAKGT